MKVLVILGALATLLCGCDSALTPHGTLVAPSIGGLSGARLPLMGLGADAGRNAVEGMNFERASPDMRAHEAEASKRLFIRPGVSVGVDVGDSQNISSGKTTYPWPPPRPSARLVVPDVLITAAPIPPRRLGDMCAMLTRILNQADYWEYSIYPAPGGFAIVTRVERFKRDGTTPAPDERFILNDNLGHLSFSEYVKGLVFAPEGLYRTITFVVTDRIIDSYSKELSRQSALDFVATGPSGLPDSTAGQGFTPRHSITVLIYEFRTGGRRQPVTTNIPGVIDAAGHLRGARLNQLVALEH